MDNVLVSLILLAVTIGSVLFSRSRPVIAQIVVEALLLFLIGAFLSWRGTTPLPHSGQLPDGAAGAWFRALAVVWWLIGARLVVAVTVVAKGRDPRSREARLFSELTAAVIYITAVLIILNSVLDLNINGVLATSGVVAIVLGLALQNTLSDVFSGIAVGLEQPFHVGDRVSLGDNVEGIVVQVNWRSIKVQTDEDDLATVPNSVVAKGQIINRSVPSKRRAAMIEFALPASVVPARIFELLRQAPLLCDDILVSPAPSVTLRRIGMQRHVYATHFYVADTPALVRARSALLCQTLRLIRHAGVGQAELSRVDLLGSLVLFESLSRKELDELSGHLRPHDVAPGDVIFEEGAEAHAIFVIETGVIELSRIGSGNVATPIGRIGPGEYVGEIGLMTGAQRAFTMKALTAARVLELPGDCIRLLVQGNARLAHTMEGSVKKGLAWLERDTAARESEPIEPSADLLGRVRAFWRLASS
ncbi:mechanosensitive ion channel family protein [Novosphingobium sp. AP12]|uniref:mechanosensitive ion channel family protein n=1 Tax=Novosphingobium sp. AP12 TaxID=1144305 RepID=UPI000271E214|nr:mechanosensitive ion channel family protein [Novosphingobium sp. AP12]EJL33393.1 small-conductance mechanosensitive channel [Novosphingobium sp. AP12]